MHTPGVTAVLAWFVRKLALVLGGDLPNVIWHLEWYLQWVKYLTWCKARDYEPPTDQCGRMTAIVLGREVLVVLMEKLSQHSTRLWRHVGNISAKLFGMRPYSAATFELKPGFLCELCNRRSRGHNPANASPSSSIICLIVESRATGNKLTASNQSASPHAMAKKKYCHALALSTSNHLLMSRSICTPRAQFAPSN
jgi:hypothetical protein